MRLDKFNNLVPIYSCGAPFDDPHDYIDHLHEALRNLGIVKANRVEFVVFQITGSTKRWWQEFSVELTSWFTFTYLGLDFTAIFEKVYSFHCKGGVP